MQNSVQQQVNDPQQILKNTNLKKQGMIMGAPMTQPASNGYTTRNITQVNTFNSNETQAHTHHLNSNNIFQPSNVKLDQMMNQYNQKFVKQLIRTANVSHPHQQPYYLQNSHLLNQHNELLQGGNSTYGNAMSMNKHPGQQIGYPNISSQSQPKSSQSHHPPALIQLKNTSVNHNQGDPTSRHSSLTSTQQYHGQAQAYMNQNQELLQMKPAQLQQNSPQQMDDTMVRNTLQSYMQGIKANQNQNHPQHLQSLYDAQQISNQLKDKDLPQQVISMNKEMVDQYILQKKANKNAVMNINANKFLQSYSEEGAYKSHQTAAPQTFQNHPSVVVTKSSSANKSYHPSSLQNNFLKHQSKPLSLPHQSTQVSHGGYTSSSKDQNGQTYPVQQPSNFLEKNNQINALQNISQVTSTGIGSAGQSREMTHEFNFRVNNHHHQKGATINQIQSQNHTRESNIGNVGSNSISKSSTTAAQGGSASGGNQAYEHLMQQFTKNLAPEVIGLNEKLNLTKNERMIQNFSQIGDLQSLNMKKEEVLNLLYEIQSLEAERIRKKSFEQHQFMKVNKFDKSQTGICLTMATLQNQGAQNAAIKQKTPTKIAQIVMPQIDNPSSQPSNTTQQDQKQQVQQQDQAYQQQDKLDTIQQQAQQSNNSKILQKYKPKEYNFLKTTRQSLQPSSCPSQQQQRNAMAKGSSMSPQPNDFIDDHGLLLKQQTHNQPRKSMQVSEQNVNAAFQKHQMMVQQNQRIMIEESPYLTQQYQINQNSLNANNNNNGLSVNSATTGKGKLSKGAKKLLQGMKTSSGKQISTSQITSVIECNQSADEINENGGTPRANSNTQQKYGFHNNKKYPMPEHLPINHVQVEGDHENSKFSIGNMQTLKKIEKQSQNQNNTQSSTGGGSRKRLNSSTKRSRSQLNNYAFNGYIFQSGMQINQIGPPQLYQRQKFNDFVKGDKLISSKMVINLNNGQQKPNQLDYGEIQQDQTSDLSNILRQNNTAASVRKKQGKLIMDKNKQQINKSLQQQPLQGIEKKLHDNILHLKHSKILVPSIQSNKLPSTSSKNHHKVVKQSQSVIAQSEQKQQQQQQQQQSNLVAFQDSSNQHPHININYNECLFITRMEGKLFLKNSYNKLPQAQIKVLLKPYTHLRQCEINDTIARLNEYTQYIVRQKAKASEQQIYKLLRYFNVSVPKQNGQLDLQGLKSNEFLNHANQKIIQRFNQLICQENGDAQPEYREQSANFLFYIGKGNNYHIVRNVLKRRQWWTKTKREDFGKVQQPQCEVDHKHPGCHFIWTQWKKDKHTEFLRQNAINKELQKNEQRSVPDTPLMNTSMISKSPNFSNTVMNNISSPTNKQQQQSSVIQNALSPKTKGIVNQTESILKQQKNQSTLKQKAGSHTLESQQNQSTHNQQQQSQQTGKTTHHKRKKHSSNNYHQDGSSHIVQSPCSGSREQRMSVLKDMYMNTKKDKHNDLDGNQQESHHVVSKQNTAKETTSKHRAMSSSPKKGSTFQNHLKELHNQSTFGHQDSVRSPKYQQNPIKQRVYGRFENNFHLSNKKALFMNISQYYRAQGLDPFEVALPFTINVRCADSSKDKEYERFVKIFNQCAKNPDDQNIWIIKPGENTNRGCGIYVSDQLSEIKYLIHSQSKNNGMRTSIVQKYIDRPLLVNNRKFDIRCFAMLTTTNGHTKGYFYRDCYFRTSSYQYNTEDLSNRYIHLTNDAIQQNNDNFGRYESANKLSIKDFQRYLDSSHHQSQNINFMRDIFPQIERLITDSFRAVYTKLNRNKVDNQFEIFGYDFMLDQDFRVYLIEANTNPCLEINCPLISRIVPELLDNSFRIALDPLFQPMQMKYLPDHYKQQSDHKEHVNMISKLAKQRKNLVNDQQQNHLPNFHTGASSHFHKDHQDNHISLNQKLHSYIQKKSRTAKIELMPQIKYQLVFDDRIDGPELEALEESINLQSNEDNQLINEIAQEEKIVADGILQDEQNEIGLEGQSDEEEDDVEEEDEY